VRSQQLEARLDEAAQAEAAAVTRKVDRLLGALAAAGAPCADLPAPDSWVSAGPEGAKTRGTALMLPAC
jgi:hypothetical protein